MRGMGKGLITVQGEMDVVLTRFNINAVENRKKGTVASKLK